MVGWQLSRRHDAQLVVDVFNHAMLNTVENATIFFHSDQGSIYGSDYFTQCVSTHRVVQSMSCRGNCWENSPMERWFRSFKSEWMIEGGYHSFESAVNDIRDYVL